MTRAIPLPTDLKASPCYFVLQRSNGEWSTGTKIIAVYPSELLAEDRAAKEKLEHPHQLFGVAALRSEARAVLNPIEIVPVGEAHEAARNN